MRGTSPSGPSSCPYALPLRRTAPPARSHCRHQARRWATAPTGRSTTGRADVLPAYKAAVDARPPHAARTLSRSATRNGGSPSARCCATSRCSRCSIASSDGRARVPRPAGAGPPAGGRPPRRARAAAPALHAPAARRVPGHRPHPARAGRAHHRRARCDQAADWRRCSRCPAGSPWWATRSRASTASAAPTSPSSCRRREQIGAERATLSANFRSAGAASSTGSTTPWASSFSSSPTCSPRTSRSSPPAARRGHQHGTVTVLGAEPHIDLPRAAAETAARARGRRRGRRRRAGAGRGLAGVARRRAAAVPRRATSPSCCRRGCRCRRCRWRSAARDVPYRAENSSLVYARPGDPGADAGAARRRRPHRRAGHRLARCAPRCSAAATATCTSGRSRTASAGDWSADRPPSCTTHPVGRGAACASARWPSRIPYSTPSQLLSWLVQRAVRDGTRARPARQPRRVAPGAVRHRPGPRVERGRRPRRAPLPAVDSAAGRRGSLRRRDRAARDRPRCGAHHDRACRQGPGVPHHHRVGPHRQAAAAPVADGWSGRPSTWALSETRRPHVRAVRTRRRADERRRTPPPAVRGMHTGDGPPRGVAAPRREAQRVGRRTTSPTPATAPRTARSSAPMPRCPLAPHRPANCRGPTKATGSPPGRPTWPRASEPAALSATTLAGWQRRQDCPPTLGLRPTRPRRPGLRKDPVDLDLPPWQRGRYGTAVGRAVHAVLQFADLRTGANIPALAAAQAAAEGVIGHERTIDRLARSALQAPIVAEGIGGPALARAVRRHPVGGTVVEGYIDLLVRHPERGLVVVDYKTDQVADGPERAQRLRALRHAAGGLRPGPGATAGRAVAGGVLVMCRTAGAGRAGRDPRLGSAARRRYGLGLVDGRVTPAECCRGRSVYRWPAAADRTPCRAANGRRRTAACFTSTSATSTANAIAKRPQHGDEQRSALARSGASTPVSTDVPSTVSVRTGSSTRGQSTSLSLAPTTASPPNSGAASRTVLTSTPGGRADADTDDVVRADLEELRLVAVVHVDQRPLT